MEINKQLFEDVLLGKLTGTFILRNGKTYFSTDLHRNFNNKFKFTHPYIMGFWSYTPKGIFSINDTTSGFDIVDFIPDTDMKEKELKIQIPNGYCIDESKSTFEKIVFKKKDNRPRSWEEYINNYTISGKEHYIGSDSNIYEMNPACIGRKFIGICVSRNWINTKELAEAFRAMMQLMSLRHDWIHKWSIDNGMTDDWKPDWTNSESDKWCIKWISNTITVYCYTELAQTLSFPTKEIAIDFMNSFKDLLKIAKLLI